MAISVYRSIIRIYSKTVKVFKKRCAKSLFLPSQRPFNRVLPKGSLENE